MAKIRWWIEQNYQQLKEELGLDHFKGRSWLGRHHHVTMTMIAFGFFTSEMIRLKKTTGLTIPKIRMMIHQFLSVLTGVCNCWGQKLRIKGYLTFT
jgi:SRSO17 transposase